MNDKIFRAYDIRGIYNVDLTEDITEYVGKAYGSVIGSGKTLGVARDVRNSSKSLATNLINGILSTGCNVIDFGEVPSPVLYFGIRKLNLSGGVMVTASHLPSEWNGFKFADENGIVISEGTGLENIRLRYFSNAFIKGNKGKYAQYFGIVKDYANFVANKIAIHKKLKLVVDYGNSVSSVVVPEILRKFDVQIFEINRELDGTFPNRTSELSEYSLQQLKREVLERHADLGIAYDGDGDRVAFLDEKGNIFTSGNVIIPIFSKYMLKQKGKGKIVFDVTCSSAVEEYIRKLGGEPIIVRVGHSYIAKEAMENKALFGGQYSGHMSFSDMDYIDDAIFASLKMIEILSSSNMKFSQRVKDIPLNITTRIREIPCSDELKFKIIENIKKKTELMDYKLLSIDGVKILDTEGWVLIRVSNTAPVIKVNADAKTTKIAKKLQNFGEKLVMEEILKWSDKQ